MEHIGRGMIKGTVIVEHFGSAGALCRRIKSTSTKPCCVCLGRDTKTKELAFKLQYREKELLYSTRGGIAIHGKFWEQGKASLRFPGQRCNILLSKADPSDLYDFLSLVGEKASQPKRARQPLIDDNSKLSDVYEAAQYMRKPVHVTPISPGEKPVLKRRRIDSEAMPSTQERKTISNNLSKEQQGVFDEATEGKNIFFTGGAGTGKSFLLKQIIKALPKESTFVTAPTGVAACNVNGMTLNSFSGVSSDPTTWGRMPKQLANWRKVRRLIVDEISMVDGRFFDELERVARVMKRNDKPFGGIQLILCGDFFQLPPVTKREDERVFAFEAKSWASCVEQCFELQEVRRQAQSEFVNILREIRMGICTQEARDLLRSTAYETTSVVEATSLCSHVREAEKVNQQKMEEIDSEEKSFRAIDELDHPRGQRGLDTLCPVGTKVRLKVGAQVLLVKNLDVSQRLVNGARGVVESFTSKGLPVVNFACGKTITVTPASFYVKGCGTRKQLPLKLAWAISIHKSQGMSIDYVKMNLSRVFECGQAYVALSRATSLEGLTVSHFDPSCVKADPKVLEFYQGLGMAS